MRTQNDRVIAGQAGNQLPGFPLLLADRDRRSAQPENWHGRIVMIACAQPTRCR